MDLNLGQTVPLVVQLGGAETNKYPIAKVYNASGSEVSGSPFTLTHVASGLYKNSAFTMPNSAFVTAQYFIYTDAGHTTLDSGSYPNIAADTFDLFDSSVFTNAVSSLISAGTALSGIVEESGTINGEVTTGDLFAEVEDC